MSLLDPRKHERDEWYRWRGKADAESAAMAERVAGLRTGISEAREEQRQQIVALHQDISRRFDKTEQTINAIHAETKQTNGRVTKLEHLVAMSQKETETAERINAEHAEHEHLAEQQRIERSRFNWTQLFAALMTLAAIGETLFLILKG